jgi:hypothetical protein
MKNLCKAECEAVEKVIYDSYNGTVDIYTNAISEYIFQKAVNSSCTNLQDSLHLAYLR